jgi:hypothetical protein
MRRRRLTLAPSVRRALGSPRATELDGGDGDTEGDEDRRCKEGREALSRAVALATEACRRPKPVHGNQCAVALSSPAQAIPSKFWAQDGFDDSDEEDLEITQSPSTPEFIGEALDAGFTIDQLARAEKALVSGNSSSSSDRHLPSSVVTKLVQRKLVGAPWQGPLPPPRVSPPRTLRDCVVKATFFKAGVYGDRALPLRQPGSLARSTPVRKKSSKKFETLNSQSLEPAFPPLSPARLPVNLTECTARVETEKADRDVKFPKKIVLGP